MKYLKFASIDIGSNAVRLLFDNVFLTEQGPVFKKAFLVRVPIRLGEDVFVLNKISDHKVDQLIDCMKSFAFLMKSHEVISYKAYATSAMREAENSQYIIKRVLQETGVLIEIISGDKEADMISSKFLPNYLKDKKEVLYVDVGGGSTEITFVSKNQKMASHSFNIGTVRLLHQKVHELEWQKMQQWLKNQNLNQSNISIIGTGGNINKIAKLLKTDSKNGIELSAILKLNQNMKPMNTDQRIIKYMLNPDRADVIVPAMDIFIFIAQICKSDKIHVPQDLGLSDGIVRSLYKEYKLNQ